jgi:hypothetical protein
VGFFNTIRKYRAFVDGSENARSRPFFVENPLIGHLPKNGSIGGEASIDIRRPSERDESSLAGDCY